MYSVIGDFIWNINWLASERYETCFARLFLILILRIDILSTSCDIGPGWVPQNPIDDNRKSTLMQVVVWCRQTSLPELMLTQISVAIWFHITTDIHSYSAKVCVEPEFHKFDMLDCRTLSLKFSQPFRPRNDNSRPRNVVYLETQNHAMKFFIRTLVADNRCWRKKQLIINMRCVDNKSRICNKIYFFYLYNRWTS